MKLGSDLLAAFQFLTRLPIPAYSFDEFSISRAAKFFPLVGLVIAGAGAGLNWLLLPHVAAPFRAALVLLLFVVLTGAFHEDGLADAVDGFGGGWTRERVLEIMHDSRIGSYGALAIGFSLLFRFLALNVLAANPWRFGMYVCVAHVLCRWSTLPLGAWLPAARTGAGAGARVAQNISIASLLGGTLFAFVVCVFALHAGAWIPILVSVIVTGATGLFYRQRLGGVTGDCFGATNQLVEISVYLCGVFH